VSAVDGPGLSSSFLVLVDEGFDLVVVVLVFVTIGSSSSGIPHLCF